MDIKALLTGKDKKRAALLIDPEKTPSAKAVELAEAASKNGFGFILVGGSLVSSSLDNYLAELKKCSRLPVIIFPGSIHQLSPHADGMLLLSLISGRNPEYLIGQHVIAAPLIKKMKIQTVSCGYIIIESGAVTSVEYMSNTRAIPPSKKDIIIATALAGELLGLQIIYLEAGSGAENSVPAGIIGDVCRNVNIPVIVGGGISKPQQLYDVFNAGASIAVIGTAIENNPGLIESFGEVAAGFI